MSTFLKWYPELKAAFKYLVPVAVGLNKTQPYAEGNVTFPNFATYIAGQTNATVGPAPSSSSASASGVSGSARPSTSISGGNNNAAAGSPSASASRAAAGASMDTGLLKGGMGALLSLVMVALGAALVL